MKKLAILCTVSLILLSGLSISEKIKSKIQIMCNIWSIPEEWADCRKTKSDKRHRLYGVFCYFINSFFNVWAGFQRTRISINPKKER